VFLTWLNLLCAIKNAQKIGLLGAAALYFASFSALFEFCRSQYVTFKESQPCACRIIPREQVIL
jgi:hypothetical protein